MSADALPTGAIRVTAASRRFKVIHEKSTTLKELLIRRKRATYTELWALDDVSFDIRPGEAVGIVGRNGSGKSTLLKLLAGIIPPHKGTVESAGSVASMLELGAGFHPDFTGRENVFMNGAIHGLSDRDVGRRLEAIVDFAELEEFIDMPVRTYSSGMQMRLAFAVAAHVDPDVMLLDEVLAVGDENFQRKCLGRIQRFRRDGGTLVFVSHDPSAVEQVCGRALLLDHGRLVADGRPAEVLEEYHRLLAHPSGSAHVGPRDAAAAAPEASMATPSDAGAPVPPAPDSAEPFHGWGTREVNVNEITLIGEGEAGGDSFLSGEPIKVRLSLLAKETIESPNIGVGVRTTDGVLCFGSNLRLDDVATVLECGQWTVDYEISGLPLQEGRFEVFVAVTSWDGADVYHWIDHGPEFTVFSRNPGVGIVAAETSWNLTAHEVHPA